jgi:hypothetical protein
MIGKLIIATAVATMFVLPATAGDTYVHGYVRKDGTYVQGYHRTSPDSNPYNNYSTKGNLNPWTGQPGYKDPTTSYHYTGPRYPTPQSGSDNDNSDQ